MDLTFEEKSAIINQHLRTMVSNLFNLHISLISEQAVDPINENSVNNINNLIEKENLKKEALMIELTRLELENKNG